MENGVRGNGVPNAIKSAVPLADAVKLEYSFLASHINSLVIARYTYFGTYLAAFGWLTTKDIKPFTLIAALTVTITVWCIELRTRVIIRAATKRMVELEEEHLGYAGFFWKSHPHQRKGNEESEGTTTTPSVEEPMTIYPYTLIISPRLGFSGIMDAFFNLVVAAITLMLGTWWMFPELFRSLVLNATSQ